MNFLVGTFRSPEIYTLEFQPPSTLTVAANSPAVGGHSWLALSKDHKKLYTTCWTNPPSIAAYRIDTSPDSAPTVTHLNTKPVKSLSGYVACTSTHLYSVGGPTGEVFLLNPDDGSIGDLVQELSFRKPNELKDGAQGEDVHGNFGGLRHGSHSVDISPDGRSLYIADIGHNCIWTYTINLSSSSSSSSSTGSEQQQEVLTLRQKLISPRTNDGPRHTWPHPNGRVLYSLQEHSSMVDAFSIASDGVTLKHLHGIKIIPADKDPKNYWADEVRLSLTSGDKPKYMYASTRGLQADTKGYVAVCRLDEEGLIVGDGALDIYETETSGGLANAVEPAPPGGPDAEVEYMALTDSQEGFVFVLGFDGRAVREVARVKLEGEGGKVVQAATAVWL